MDGLALPPLVGFGTYLHPKSGGQVHGRTVPFAVGFYNPAYYWKVRKGTELLVDWARSSKRS